MPAVGTRRSLVAPAPIGLLEVVNVPDGAREAGFRRFVHRTLAVVLRLPEQFLVGRLPLVVQRLQQVMTSIPELVVGRYGGRLAIQRYGAREPVGFLVALDDLL